MIDSNNDLITLDLTTEERDLLVEILPTSLSNTIKGVTKRGESYACSFSQEVVLEIVDVIRRVLPRLDVPADLRCLRRLLKHILAILDFRREPVSEFPEWPSQLPPEIREKLEQVFHHGEYSSLIEINVAIGGIMEGYNQSPQEEMGGLSPVQVSRLLHTEWNSESSPIQFNSYLTLDDLGAVRFLANARFVLDKAKDGIKATANGNLNRKFVSECLINMRFSERFLEWSRYFPKAINEEDLSPLHQVRINLELAGLIYKRKGVFRTTTKGQNLLVEENVGNLFSLLFTTFFRRFNLAELDGVSYEVPIQDTIAFSFLQIHKHADDWHPFSELSRMLLLPAVMESINPNHFEIDLNVLCEQRINRPLEEFGLVEIREATSDKGKRWSCEMRKTALFDRFLKFTL